MRVSCSVPVNLASSTLVDHIKILGIHPIITSEVIRAVYEGDDVSIGEALIDMFSHEADHHITADYRNTQEKREAHRAAKRSWRAYSGGKELIHLSPPNSP